MATDPTDVPEWRLTFHNAESFRNLVEAASSVMPKVVFHVAKEGSERFLMVDGSDMALTCWLRARLAVDDFAFPKGEQGRDSFTFCVECKHVLIAIDTASLASSSVVLEGYESRAKVQVHVRDPDQDGFSEQSDLDTYVDGERPQHRLQPLQYKMMMEIDVLRLRDLVRRARRAHAEFVRYTISLNGVGNHALSRVTMSYHGDLTARLCFMNRTQTDDDGSIIVRAVTDAMEEGTEADESSLSPALFSGSFALDKIEAFLKVIKCRIVTTRVEQDQPMLFEVPLGADNVSYVHFLIAPKVEDY